jgi:gas vesicle protein
MTITDVYDRVVNLGAYRDLTGAVIGVVVARIAAHHPLKKLRKRLASIEDQLDTSTPGGLTDVMNAVKDRNESEERT